MTRRLNANELQIRVWSNDGSDNPFTYPAHAMAFSQDSGIGPESGTWFQSGGTPGKKPEGDLLKQLETFEKAKGVPAEERKALGQEISKLMADNVWIIGTVGVSPALLGIVIKKNNMGNVPDQCGRHARRRRPPATPGRSSSTSRREPVLSGAGASSGVGPCAAVEPEARARSVSRARCCSPICFGG